MILSIGIFRTWILIFGEIADLLAIERFQVASKKLPVFKSGKELKERVDYI